MAGEYAKLPSAEQPGAGTPMDAGEAIAREQIRDVISRYNHAGDRGDLETLARCFGEDGVLDIEGEDACAGRAAILRRLSGVVDDSVARGERAFVRHHVSSVTSLLAPSSMPATSTRRGRRWDWLNAGSG